MLLPEHWCIFRKFQHCVCTGSKLDLVSLYDLLSFSEFLLGNYESCEMYTDELLRNGMCVDPYKTTPC